MRDAVLPSVAKDLLFRFLLRRAGTATSVDESRFETTVPRWRACDGVDGMLGERQTGMIGKPAAGRESGRHDQVTMSWDSRRAAGQR